ncbi:protein of unknown function [Candidatus Nitrotoga arctica]|uniref:CsbD-like n=1 Tax=Candidatus Nitrotoga arctica TaxID=453162 RepID=A0ABN8AMZ7_9PROT|nr:protein of unknown function [Candidatus Nitrotoga arctica]
MVINFQEIFMNKDDDKDMEVKGKLQKNIGKAQVGFGDLKE